MSTRTQYRIVCYKLHNTVKFKFYKLHNTVKFKFKFKLNTSFSGPQAFDRNLWIPLFARL